MSGTIDAIRTFGSTRTIRSHSPEKGGFGGDAHLPEQP